jgi:uroporphyrinogen decarboxylase
MISGDSENTGAAVKAISNRERFLKACRCEPLDYPPMWMMRQAGRSLPEYMAVKEKHSFVEIVQTPELATEVTLQPIRRFDHDAAILFSDILVICEAMGQSYGFSDKGGIEMAFKVQSEADVNRLETGAIRERLDYVARALPLIRDSLDGKTALIGFAGSPWTLANYMMEGGSSREFVAAKNLLYTDPKTLNSLLEKLTAACIEYLQMQIECGVDAVQIFDTQGGVLADHVFHEASGRWMREIVSTLKDQVPVIIFSKGASANREALEKTGATVLSVDWTCDLADFRRALPDKMAVQGNLDPTLLTTTPEAAAAETQRLLTRMRGLTGHIFNLGHGVTPQAKIDCIEAVRSTVKNFR